MYRAILSFRTTIQGDVYTVNLILKHILPLFLAAALGLSWLPAGALAQEIQADSESSAGVSGPEAPVPTDEETLPAAEETLPAPEETVCVTEQTLPATEETVPLTEATCPATEETVPADEEPIPGTLETKPEETLSAETAALTALPQEPPGPGLYFGQLHAHSALSDGTVTPEEAFSLAALAGMDFLALTDHGDSLTEADWATGRAAAGAAGHSFVGIYGYEMNWPAQMQNGHITAFCTPGFHCWQEGFEDPEDALERYYAAMAALPGAIGQFCHPGTRYGNFRDFVAYSPSADSFMQLLETDGSCGAYIQALDQGWHVAPSWASDSRSGDFGSGRTAVYADALTEEGIFDALRSHRVYATEDADLQILYTLDGYDIGSVLEEKILGETADIAVTLSDPTDSSIGVVDVMGGSGTVLASQTLSAASGSLHFSLSPEQPYYFLRVTQPDGHIAVTAPVWVSHTEDLGIAAFCCETAVPVRNEEISLTLSLYNRESTDFLVDSLEILADGDVIFTDSGLTGIPAGSDLTHTLTLTCDRLGQTTLTARLSGTLDGSPRTYEANLTLSFRQSELVTGILIDGSHGNAGLDQLTLLAALAAEHDIRVTIAEEVTAQALRDCRFLVVPAPGAPFSQEFLNIAAEYAASGGSVILCGQADSRDDDIHSAFQLNRLLSALGSSLRIQDDDIRDAADSSILYTDSFNADSPWCAGLSPEQVYCISSGCTVEANGGQWLVSASAHSIDGDGDGLGGQEEDGVTVLACEELISGGTVFAAGSLFFSDGNIPVPEHQWKEPFANRTILRNLLSLEDEALPLHTIADVRAGEAGEMFRVRGFVTAGTSSPYTTFPDTIYLQDDTGGIAVTPFAENGIRIGTPMEIIGYADIQNGNRVLKMISFQVLDAAMYQYQPRTGSWKTLLDYGKNGGMLVEIEGECTAVLCREDGTLSGILLKNEAGQTAKVLIEDMIFSGATGKNALQEEIHRGRTVRAMGLLHISEGGETVIRVRNCDEVVYVPPNTYVNPKTGDPLPLSAAAMVISGTLLLLLQKRKRA